MVAGEKWHNSGACAKCAQRQGEFHGSPWDRQPTHGIRGCKAVTGKEGRKEGKEGRKGGGNQPETTLGGSHGPTLVYRAL